jgi:tetratricopeptide (TPR) repeat protein
MRLKRADTALADAETAVTLRPESGEVYLFRGRLHEARREFAEARSDFERELQLDREPRPASLNGAAWFYATCPDNAVRDGKRAVELAKKACALTQWKDAHILDTLAAAYAEAGDFIEAVKWQTQALDSTDEPADMCSRMQQRLWLYETRQPYRQELKP